MYAATTKDEGNAADACLPVGRGVFQQPANQILAVRKEPFSIDPTWSSLILLDSETFSKDRLRDALSLLNYLPGDSIKASSKEEDSSVLSMLLVFL